MACFQFYVESNMFKISLEESLVINVSSPFQEKFFFQIQFTNENLLPSIKTFLQSIQEVYNYLKSNSKEKISFQEETGKFTIKMHVCQKLKEVCFNLQKVFVNPYENLQKRVNSLTQQLIKMTEKNKKQIEKYEQCQKLLTKKVKQQQQQLTLNLLQIQEKDKLILKFQEQIKSLRQICTQNENNELDNKESQQQRPKSKIQQVAFFKLKKQKPQVDLTANNQQIQLAQYKIKSQHLDKSDDEKQQTKSAVMTSNKRGSKKKEDSQYEYQYHEQKRQSQKNSQSQSSFVVTNDKKKTKKGKQTNKKKINVNSKGNAKNINKNLQGLKLGRKHEKTVQVQQGQIEKTQHQHLSEQQLLQLKNYLKLNKLPKLQTLIREEKLSTANFITLHFHKLIVIPPFPQLKNLARLNLSNNQIVQINNLGKLVFLRQLNLEKNLIKKIQNLETLTQLSILNLSFNKIQIIENLSSLLSLNTLNLNSNSISVIGDGLDSLKDTLKQLRLENNMGMRYLDLRNIQKITQLNKTIGCILWKQKLPATRQINFLREKQQKNINF